MCAPYKHMRHRANLIRLRLIFRPEVACLTAVVSIPIARLKDSFRHVSKPQGQALMQIYFFMPKNTLCMAERSDKMKLLRSKHFSTELAGPGYPF